MSPKPLWESEAWEFNALFVPFGVGNEVINPLGDPYMTKTVHIRRRAKIIL